MTSSTCLREGSESVSADGDASGRCQGDGLTRWRRISRAPDARSRRATPVPSGWNGCETTAA
jgi:hypothetical protein